MILIYEQKNNKKKIITIKRNTFKLVCDCKANIVFNKNLKLIIF